MISTTATVARCASGRCRCTCHRPEIIALEMRRDLAAGRTLIADVEAETRSGIDREFRARLELERAARYEEARTGRYRTVEDRRTAARASATAALFGTRPEAAA